MKKHFVTQLFIINEKEKLALARVLHLFLGHCSQVRLKALD